MDEMINSLVEEVNSLSINNIKEKIRNKLYNDIEKLRKYDDQISKKMESLEYNLWRELLKDHDSNFKDLFKIYDSLKSLEIGIDYFKNSVNPN